MSKQMVPEDMVQEALEQFRRNMNPETADRYDYARKYGYSSVFASVYAEQEQRKAKRETEEV